jgi:ABC-type lipoprotein release transport system permease subunit
MVLIRIAARNLRRNIRRTIITTSAMSFALAVMIFFTGFLDGYLGELEHNITALNLSKIQIHHPDYRDDPSIYNTIDNTPALVEKLEAAGYSVAPRMYSYGLAATGNESAGVIIRGVDTVREPRVTDLFRHVGTGRFLSSEDSISGNRGVVIGRKLARTLHASLGDELVIVSQAADGSIANDLFYVSGILKTVSEPIDRSGFFITDMAFIDLMGTGEDVHEIAIRPPENRDLESATSEVASMAAGMETLHWRELAPDVADILDMSRVSMILLYLIGYAAISLVILNAMLMAVFERIREFGIMKALGVRPGQVWWIINLEALFQTVIAAFAGIALGLPVTLYFSHTGIDLSGISTGIVFSGIALDPVMTPIVSLHTVMHPVIYLAGMVWLAVIYPGLKAAVIRPVKAICHR